jgi:hypothetical protein
MTKFLPLALLLCSAAFADETSMLQIGELPGQKKFETLQQKERNPFMRREAKVATENSERESEESKLRDMFKSMPVTGVIRGGGTVKVLLGELILKEGEPLPPLIADQTERLIVGPVTDRQVEIDFIENDEHAEPRKIFVPIDMRPRVAIVPTVVAPAPEPSGADRSEAVLRPPVQ